MAAWRGSISIAYGIAKANSIKRGKKTASQAAAISIMASWQHQCWHQRRRHRKHQQAYEKYRGENINQ